MFAEGLILKRGAAVLEPHEFLQIKHFLSKSYPSMIAAWLPSEIPNQLMDEFDEKTAKIIKKCCLLYKEVKYNKEKGDIFLKNFGR
ncbi:hypothetical protein M9Y10_030696 [Tritrichomonas musculus]|uniref:Uncharacterized protein n=1 Tax=Tritrichomonas musculus TaxID=1915356 RepID=A0ABR2H2P6_9EUKA